MEIFIGLDVSLASTSVCALNVNGETVNEAKVPSDPRSLAGHLRELPGSVAAVGLEAEKVNKMQLAAGDAAQLALPRTCPGLMLKPAKPFVEERCSAVSLDGGAIDEVFRT